MNHEYNDYGICVKCHAPRICPGSYYNYDNYNTEVKHNMTFKEYSECQIRIIQVLKKKYTNLSAEEAARLASLILEQIIIVLNLQQE